MNKVDRIFETFIEGQITAVQSLNQESDIVHITPQKLNRGHLFMVDLLCKGLVNDSGTIKEHGHFELAVYFAEHYLRRCNPLQIVCWYSPANIWHPNIKISPRVICLGRVTPGTQIVDIVHQAYEIITYQKFTSVESDALNPDACVWARAHMERFPIDNRPLRRRRIEFTMEEIRKEMQE